MSELSLLACLLLSYVVVNHTHARGTKWSFMSCCSLVSMFLPCAKCFPLLQAELPAAHFAVPPRLEGQLASWHWPKTGTFCFTGDHGAALRGNNEVRLCEKQTRAPPCSSCVMLSSTEGYGEASRAIVAEAMLESATLENRKKLLPRCLLSFFLFCAMLVVLHGQGFKKFSQLVFFLWA